MRFMVLVLLAGCLPPIGTVTMSGVVHDAPDSQGTLVEGVTVEVTNMEGVVTGTAVTDFDGSFSVLVPEGVDFFVAVRGEGYTPTHFSGVAGIYDFQAGDGYPWIAPDAWVDDLREEFSACPTAQEPGGIVTGEVRLYISGFPASGTPLIDSAEVRVYGTSDDVVREACYLDDTGASLADGVVTGDSGRFAVFGVPAGFAAVEVLYNDPSGDEVSSHPQYILDEGGLVPMYPAWAYTTQQ